MDVHTIMALRPLAPVLRSIACRAIALMASWVNSKLHYKHRTVIENTLLAFCNKVYRAPASCLRQMSSLKKSD